MKESGNRPYTADQLRTAKDSIISSLPQQGRSAREYLHQLNVRREDLQGKRVLDLGAGNELRFVRELPEEGIQAEVVSYSPAFSDGKAWKRWTAERQHLPDGLAVVAGMAEQLPFAGDSFDTVLMFYVTLHMDEDARMTECLSEIARVLKPGGVAYIGPLIIRPKDEHLKGIDRSKRWLDENKVAEALQGKAKATWENAPRLPAGSDARTLRIVKNTE